MKRPEPHTAEFLAVSDGNVEMSGLTDVGLVRSHNEDSFLFANLVTGERATGVSGAGFHVHRAPALMIVADGVGGAASGELASSMATDEAFQHLMQQWEGGQMKGTVGIADHMRQAVQVANDAILGHARENPSHRGMGTTATVALVVGDLLYLAQVGDSRAYIVRDGVARQVTKDQSLVQRLVDAGRLTPEQAEKSEHRNIILQALGPEESVEPELTRERLKTGDVVLVCSDGLSNQVTSAEMATIADIAAPLDGICAALVARARETGAPDNVTVIAGRYWRDRDRPR